MKKLLLLSTLFAGAGASAQLVIDNATFFIGENAVVTVQGNVQSNVSIQAGGAGATLGKLQLKGTAAQTLNMGGVGNRVPRLEIDNTNHVQLTSGAKVGNLEFTNGKLQLGNNDLVYTGTVTGAAAGKFVETDGTGFLRDSVGTGAVVNAVLPVGNGSDYTPITITSAANNTGANATVGARATGVAVPTPTRHPRTEAYLSTEWAYETQNLASAGALTGTATYVGGDVVLAPSTNLTATDITGFSRVGSTWSLAGTTKAANSVGATLPGTSGSLYGMNTFVLASPKAFLQGAFFNPVTPGVMNDALRTNVAYSAGNYPASNLIPLSDPYRTATYSTQFAHLLNPVGETIVQSVLNDLANPENQIVDWIFLELRNTATSGNAVLQTRSGLLQRDGDIVDIDGISPIYFKNVGAASYSIGIRHRNHIGMYTNPTNFTVPLGLTTSAVDFSTLAATNLMGTANSNYLNANSRNQLYAGNANLNTRVSYSASANDAAFILSTLLGSNVNTILLNTYSQGDANFNRRVSYSGSGNDAAFILATPLLSNINTLRIEVKPN